MGLLSAIRARNASLVLSPAQTAVVVGGTSGIGEAIARRMARAGASVVLVGRNEAKANEIIRGFEGNPEAKHAFVQCDCLLLESVYDCVKNRLKALVGTSGIHSLILSQGITSISGRNETKEGLDQKMALHYFSRVAFIESLIPELEQAEGRVLSVFSAGVHSAFAGYREDPNLERSFSLKNAADSCGFYNDLALDQLSREHPQLTFIHSAPGFVKTNWGSDLPWVLRGLVRTMQLFAKSPDDCAEFMCAPLLDPDLKPGFHLFNEHAGPASPTSMHTDEAREFVTKFTREVLSKHLSK